MTPADLHWLIGTLIGCALTVVGAVVYLATLTYGIGRKYGHVEAKLEKFELATTRLEKTQEKLERAHERLEQIPVIQRELATLKDSHDEVRKRFASEWPAMKSRMDVLESKVVSIREWKAQQAPPRPRK